MDLPDEQHRWRCQHCGNLTRFDVERLRRTEEFWHMDLAGQPEVEQVTVLAQEIVRVRCRWCGSEDGVALVPRPDQESAEGLGGTP